MEVEVKLVDAIEVDVVLCTPVVVRDGFQPITLTNSNGSVQIIISEFPLGGTYELQDVTHIDSDEEEVPTPALTPFEATTCPVFELVLVQSSGKTYSITASSGDIITLPDSVITEINGSTTIIEATTNHRCQWYAIELTNSAGVLVDTIPTFPLNAKHVLPDVTHTEVNGDQVVKAANEAMVCDWKDVILKDQNGNVLGTISSFPVGGEYELIIEGGNVFNVSNSFVANTQIQNDYYYGNSLYGWNYIVWSARDSDMASIFHTNHNSGITVTGDYTSVSVKGIIQNTSNPDISYTLGIWKTPRPDGSSSSFSPTLLATQDITCTIEGNFYNFDLAESGLTISDGELLFFTIRRTSGAANATNNTNVSLTIECS